MILNRAKHIFVIMILSKVSQNVLGFFGVENIRKILMCCEKISKLLTLCNAETRSSKAAFDYIGGDWTQSPLQQLPHIPRQLLN